MQRCDKEFHPIDLDDERAHNNNIPPLSIAVRKWYPIRDKNGPQEEEEDYSIF